MACVLFVLTARGSSRSPQKVELTIPAGGTAKATTTISVPAAYTNPLASVAIALDVVADGRYLGQITEVVVDLRTRQT